MFCFVFIVGRQIDDDDDGERESREEPVNTKDKRRM
jgi:hypothetical protein